MKADNMKWYEFSTDSGDGSSRQLRFRTMEEAQAYRDKMEEDEYFMQDGDGSPVYEVDTESGFFYHVY